MYKFRFFQSAKLPDGSEVRYRFQENGNVLFSMTNKYWFYKFISGPLDGITVDIVPKSRYQCNTNLADDAILGKLLKPVYQAELIKNMQDLGGGEISINLGNLPEDMRGKEIEGNLVLINNDKICSNTFFLDIPRSLWELLPMGLFADTLMHAIQPLDDEFQPTPYVSQLEFIIPFSKNGVTYMNWSSSLTWTQ